MPNNDVCRTTIHRVGELPNIAAEAAKEENDKPAADTAAATAAGARLQRYRSFSLEK